jgi:serine/threonine protein kinase/formylglycine-generating enzyme required for sulfatase activity
MMEKMRLMNDEILRAFVEKHGLTQAHEEQLRQSLEQLSGALGEEAQEKLMVLLNEMFGAEGQDADNDQREATQETLWGEVSLPRSTVTAIRRLSLEGNVAVGAPVIGAQAAGVERYRDLGSLGEGGMGEVRRVVDASLGRTLAMKVIRGEFASSERMAAKFMEEAQISAQLQHPGIVPVYELGRLPDGRLYFTMQEVKGEHFGVLIQRFYERVGDVGVVGDLPSLRRFIDIFHRVCEAVGYAHRRGVIHRDLKPENVMVGSEGRVLVVDWGIAKAFGVSAEGIAEEIFGQVAEGTQGDADEEVRVGQRDATRFGSLTGTPAYMAPEQLLGRTDQVNARSDVYALGAILYEILSGEPPKGADGGLGWAGMLSRAQGEVRRLDEVKAGLGVLRELVEICHRALRNRQDERFANAGEMGEAVGGWLEGVKQREQALVLVKEAALLATNGAELRQRAHSLRQLATARLQEIPVWASEDTKRPFWQQHDDADAADREAAQCGLESERRLYAALTFVPGLVEAHQALALRYAAEHADAEAHKRAEDATRAEFFVRTHIAELPEGSDVKRRLTAYLRAEGALTLEAEPPDAHVSIHPYVHQGRRLHEGEALGGVIKMPLVEHALPVGSYVLRISAPGRDSVSYPVEIKRGQHWEIVTPEGNAEKVWLPPEGSVGADEVYVPGGWFRAGGDPAAFNAVPDCTLWVDGFVIRRAPITNREYRAFLNDLIRRGETTKAERFSPIDMKTLPPRPLFQRGLDGSFWSADEAFDGLPVVYIDWLSAVAFCEWLAETTKRPWRLPDEMEWEKAARGVDGRPYPWGDWLDPSWCWMRDSHPQVSAPTETSTYPIDASPYGVLGMAGNTMDWCANLFVAPDQFNKSLRRVVPAVVSQDERADEGGAPRLYRGGSWSYNAPLCRVARRFRHAPNTRVNDLGVRPVRSQP